MDGGGCWQGTLDKRAAGGFDCWTEKKETRFGKIQKRGVIMLRFEASAGPQGTKGWAEKGDNKHMYHHIFRIEGLRLFVFRIGMLK